MEFKKPLPSEIVGSFADVLDRMPPAGDVDASSHERLWDSLPAHYTVAPSVDGLDERWARSASLAAGGAGANGAMRGH